MCRAWDMTVGLQWEKMGVLMKCKEIAGGKAGTAGDGCTQGRKWPGDMQ